MSGMRKVLTTALIAMLTASTLLVGCSKSDKDQSVANSPITSASEQDIAFATKLVQCAAGYERQLKTLKIIIKDPHDERIVNLMNMIDNNKGGAKKYAEIKGINQSKLDSQYSDFSKHYEEKPSEFSNDSCFEFYKNNIGTIDELFILHKFQKLGRLNEEYTYPKDSSLDKNTLMSVRVEGAECMGLYLSLVKEFENKELRENISSYNLLFKAMSNVSYYSQLLLDGRVNLDKNKYNLQNAISTAYSIRRESENYAKDIEKSAREFVKIVDGQGGTDETLSLIAIRKVEACNALMKKNEFNKIVKIYDDDFETPNGFYPK